jgi:hypothetical protein
VRKLILIGFTAVALALSACGGGSGSVATSTSNSGGGGGGGGGGGSGSSNSVTVTVDAGPNNNDVDTPFITVTVCAPGSTSNCQQIDHVEVDTGSYGLRVISSVLNASLASALQQETGNGNYPIVECTQFADGYSWGPVEVADVQVAGESASSVPIQVIGDAAFEGEIPTGCSSTGTKEDTVATFGANAILGIGVFSDDCGSGCANSADNGWYFACPANGVSTSACTGAAIPESAQVTDPVVFFQTDNNGVIVEMPAVVEGAGSASGTLVFGIGTQSNNTLTARTVLFGDVAHNGGVTTQYTTQSGKQQYLPWSYFDTGSNAYYFADDGIPSTSACSSYPGYDSQNPQSWFCPSSELNLSATNIGTNGTQSTVNFSIGNAYTVLSGSSGTVFDDLGASVGTPLTACGNLSTADPDKSCAFDFGFPFFLGRNVFIAFAGANTANGMGPYFAY